MKHIRFGALMILALLVFGCSQKSAFESVEVQPSQAVCDVTNDNLELVLCHYTTALHSQTIEHEFEKAYANAQSYWEPISPLAASATAYDDRRFKAENYALELAVARFDLAASYTARINKLVQSLDLLENFKPEMIRQHGEDKAGRWLLYARRQLAGGETQAAQDLLNGIDRDLERTPENNGRMAYIRAKLFELDWQSGGANGLLRTAVRKHPGHLPYLIEARDWSKLTGNLDEFFDHAEAAMKAMTEEGSVENDPVAAAHTFVERAESYRYQGECIQALPFYERGLSMIADQPAANRDWVLVAWAGKGLCEFEEGYEQASFVGLERELENWPPMHPRTQFALDVLANNDLSARDYEAARQYLDRLLESIEHNFDRNHLDNARTLDGLAEAKIAIGDLDAASDDLERAMAIKQRWFGDTDISLVPTLHLMAAVERRRGRETTADAYDSRADEIRQTEWSGDVVKDLQKAIERNMQKR